MRRFLGSLNYISDSCRPDISTATSLLSSAANFDDPTEENSIAAARLARYLRHCKPQTGLCYDGTTFTNVIDNLLPRLHVDSDFARSDDCKFRSGILTYMANGPVYWKSKRQGLVSTSTCEAELIALSEACKPLLWIRNLLSEFGFDLPASPVYEDNDSAVQLATEESGSSRSRHINPRHMWTRQLKDYDIIRITKIATEENLSDYLTKILKISTQERAIDRLVRSPPN